MPLKSIVIEAKKNTPQPKAYDPSRPIANFIDLTNEKPEDNQSAGELWKQCKHRKEGPYASLCMQFNCHCVKDKCKRKWMKF